MVQVHRGWAITTTIGPPWLQRLLGNRGGFLLDRVEEIYFIDPDIQYCDSITLTDTEMAMLDGLSELRILRLPSLDVRNPGLIHLKNLGALQSLDLHYTGVTDAGLAQLENLKGLRELYVNGPPTAGPKGDQANSVVPIANGSQITAVGMATLSKALPGCKITVWDARFGRPMLRITDNN